MQIDFLQVKETDQSTLRAILVSNNNETLKINIADLVLNE
jgi:hypothetical protein